MNFNMETFKIEGVVLNTTNFGDSGRVVTLYTKEFGKLETNAYGCRRAKNPLSGATQMFNHISAEISQGSKVETIREAEVLNFYGNLTADIERLAYAAFFFEIVNKMTLPKFPEPDIFDLLIKSLPALNSRNPKIAALIGACQFMQLSGVQLNFTNCVHCGKILEGDATISLRDGGAVCLDCKEKSADASTYSEFLRQTFETMLKFDWHDGTKLTFKARQIQAAEKFFLTYLKSVLGKELNSVKFIRQLEGLKL